MSFKTSAAALALLLSAGVASAQTAQPARPAAPAAPMTAPVAAPAPAAQPAAKANQLVNLNTATAADLDKLPQIGEKRSADIIAKRPYKDWNDFVAKKVVPSNAEAAIKDKVRFR